MQPTAALFLRLISPCFNLGPKVGVSLSLPSLHSFHISALPQRLFILHRIGPSCFASLFLSLYLALFFRKVLGVGCGNPQGVSQKHAITSTVQLNLHWVKSKFSYLAYGEEKNMRKDKRLLSACP